MKNKKVKWFNIDRFENLLHDCFFLASILDEAKSFAQSRDIPDRSDNEPDIGRIRN
jgi:hypothetical protein